MEKNKNYKITIVTVVKNSSKTIEKTIKSVLNQNYTNLEYILIDGLSNDGTSEIINKYKDKISIHIRESDNGIWDARVSVTIDEFDQLLREWLEDQHH